MIQLLGFYSLHLILYPKLASISWIIIIIIIIWHGMEIRGALV